MLINFRDFGAKRTMAGDHLPPDRLFRSGHLARLDEVTSDRLLALDFVDVIDLRYGDEREKDRSPWPGKLSDNVLYHHGATTEDAPHLGIIAAIMMGHSTIDDAYTRFYAALPFDQWYRPLFAEAIRRLSTSSGRILIHCSAGKDRTGMLVALLLDVLGVSRETIVAEYMLSKNAPGLAQLRDDIVARMAISATRPIDDRTADALIGVEPHYIGAMFDAIEARSGSTANYLSEGGVGPDVIKRLRMNFLTD